MGNAPHFDIDPAAILARSLSGARALRARRRSRSCRNSAARCSRAATTSSSRRSRSTCFSSHQPQGLMNRLMGHNMMRKDGDAHMAERKAIFPRRLAEDRQGALDRAVPGACRPDPRRARAGAAAPTSCKDFALPLVGRMPESRSPASPTCAIRTWTPGRRP